MAKILVFLVWVAAAAAQTTLPNLFPFPNAAGLAATENAGGAPIDLTGPFFQVLGTNGRSCSSCHRPAEGWSISADEVRARFMMTRGLDPIFRTVDGSNCDQHIDTSTVDGRRQAYSLLIGRALLRITMAMPAGAEFRVVSVRNPYGCDDVSSLAVYRRPLPAANLRFLSAVMWDGRESSVQTGTQKITYATNPADLVADLTHQALDATLGHAQASKPPSAQQLADIARFEMSLATAQLYDRGAGALNQGGADGGPEYLSQATMPAFYIGMNDALGGDPDGAPFSPAIFHLFDQWSKSASPRRASIARGEQIFNSKPIRITGVAGLNDDLNLPVINGTCGTCHDSTDAGNHSLSVPLNIGVGDVSSPLDVSYLPVITLENLATHETKVTTDPGRALITGLWKDVGRMKGPVLRGLASRAPYFHNGSAQSLGDAVEFYDRRFHIGFTSQEKEDLIAFLSAL